MCFYTTSIGETYQLNKRHRIKKGRIQDLMKSIEVQRGLSPTTQTKTEQSDVVNKRFYLKRDQLNSIEILDGKGMTVLQGSPVMESCSKVTGGHSSVIRL